MHRRRNVLANSFDTFSQNISKVTLETIKTKEIPNLWFTELLDCISSFLSFWPVWNKRFDVIGIKPEQK